MTNPPHVEDISPSYVSKLAKELMKGCRVLFIPIEEYVPYLFVAASYLKIREGSRCVSEVLLLIAGVRSDDLWRSNGSKDRGFREGVNMGMSFPILKGEGLNGGPDHFGLPQRNSDTCKTIHYRILLALGHVHFIRAILRKIPEKTSTAWFLTCWKVPCHILPEAAGMRRWTVYQRICRGLRYCWTHYSRAP